MILVVSHSLGANYKNGERIIRKKWFKKRGLFFYLYYIYQLFLEDYIEVYEEDGK